MRPRLHNLANAKKRLTQILSFRNHYFAEEVWGSAGQF
jgi:hypothetical protein